MSLFDPKHIPDNHITEDLINNINGLIDRLRARRIDSISLASDIRAKGLIRCYIQAHIRRCLTFIEAGHFEFFAGRSLVTSSCARANYENVASFCDFSDKLIQLIGAGDQAAILNFVDQRAFSTRIPDLIQEHGREITATNILTQIDKMNQKYPSYRSAYDHLSESVHPNAFGSVVHFVSIDNEKAVATFNDIGRHPEWALASLIMSALLLAHLEQSIVDIEHALNQLK